LDKQGFIGEFFKLTDLEKDQQICLKKSKQDESKRAKATQHWAGPTLPPGARARRV
jgi:hypothetical protein